jgi:hypothetical protein
MTTVVTRQQYFTAVAQLGNMATLYAAVNANPGDATWIEFWSGSYVTLGDTLSNLTASALGWNASQMQLLFNTAAAVPVTPGGSGAATGNTTALDIINLAMRDAGILAAGQAAPAIDSNDAFKRLNWMIGQWNRKRWLIYQLVDKAIPSTGAAAYTIGPLGDVNVAKRPDKLEAAYFRQLTTSVAGLPIDYPLSILNSYEDYARISTKTLGSFSGCVFYDPGFPLGTLRFWPIAAASLYEYHIIIKAVLPQFYNVNDTVNLPDEYMMALYLNLARYLRMGYRLPADPELNAMAKDALEVIRGANIAVPRLVMPQDLSRGQVYNVYTDQTR